MTIHCAHTRVVPLAELEQKRNPKNPNTHSAAQIAALAAVFEANGIRSPAVVSNRSGLMTKGHGRIEAALLQGRDKNLGGNSLFRSPEKIEAEKRYLQSKWKGSITLEEYQSQDRVKMNVDRRQRVDL